MKGYLRTNRCRIQSNISKNKGNSYATEGLKPPEKKTPPWTLEDVKVVLRDLKKKISKDPYDLPHELFLWFNAGDDLVLAILKLMNKMNDQLIFPECLQICNVTNAYKNTFRLILRLVQNTSISKHSGQTSIQWYVRSNRR